MSEANEDVMRRFIEEVINTGDYGVLNDLIQPNYVYRTPDQELQGVESIQALFTAYRIAFPDLNVSIDDLVASDDRVVVAFTLTGTHEGDLMGIPATGKSVEVHGVILSRLEDGKIAEEWEILDMLAMFQQLGVVSLPA